MCESRLWKGKYMEKKKIEWEKPELVEISTSKVITHGAPYCSSGSTDALDCVNGSYFVD
jgi:hypothetical protein